MVDVKRLVADALAVVLQMSFLIRCFYLRTNEVGSRQPVAVYFPPIITAGFFDTLLV